MLIRAFESVRSEWCARCHGPRAALAFEKILAAEPELGCTGASSLEELFASAGGTAPSGPLARWEVTTALIRQFGSDELIGIGLLVLLLPGLAHIGKRLGWGREGSWEGVESFASDVVATTWSVLAELAGATVAFPERTVLDRVRLRLRHQLERDWQAASRSTPMGTAWRQDGEHLDIDFADSRPISVLESLTMALRNLPMSDVPLEDVNLVFAHRVLGYSFSELATKSGLPASTLKLRSKRAELIMSA